MRSMLEAMLGAYAWSIAPGYARHAMHVRTYETDATTTHLGMNITLGNARTRVAKIPRIGVKR